MPVLLKETRSPRKFKYADRLKKKFLVTLGCVVYVEWLGWGGQKWCLLCSIELTSLCHFYREDFRNTPGIKKNRMGGWPVLGLWRVFNWRSPIFRLPRLLERKMADLEKCHDFHLMDNGPRWFYGNAGREEVQGQAGARWEGESGICASGRVSTGCSLCESPPTTWR